MATWIKREHYCEANLASEKIDTLCYYNCQKCIPPQNDLNNSHLLFFFFFLSHFWCCSWFFIVLPSRLKRRSSSSQSPRPKKRKKKKSGRRRSRWAETAMNFFYLLFLLTDKSMFYQMLLWYNWVLAQTNDLELSSDKVRKKETEKLLSEMWSERQSWGGEKLSEDLQL